MHEFSIAAALVAQLQDVARAQRATRIVELELRCGVMQQIVPECLQLAFEAVSADTLVAGARLKIVEETVVARCRACGLEFQAAIDNYLCTRCQTADVEIMAGRDITLRTVVCVGLLLLLMLRVEVAKNRVGR